MIRYILAQRWDGYMLYGNINVYRVGFKVEIGDHLLVDTGQCVVVTDDDPPTFRIRRIQREGFWVAKRILGRFPGKWEDHRLSPKQMKEWYAAHPRIKPDDGRLAKNRKGKDEEKV